MKLQAEINHEKHAIELHLVGTKVLAHVDGRSYELEVSEPEPNIFLLKDGGGIYQVFVSPPADPDGPLSVTVGTAAFEVAITDLKRLRGSLASGEQAGGLAEIKTAMPGKVVRVLVAEGDQVKKGDGIIVVEAMKMQNELKSQKDGTVQEIRVAEGATVAAGDILVILE